jgi:hypothetical protein
VAKLTKHNIKWCHANITIPPEWLTECGVTAEHLVLGTN